ncbi:MAG: sigma-70 family RNA polymerase sigma factor [Planctomycetota bacterium]
MNGRPATPRSLTGAERAQLDKLVHECGPRLLGYVRRMYARRIDAEDIVAETFCRAAANIETLNGCERPDLYLLTIARNLCRDFLRRRRETPAGDSLPDQPAAARQPAQCFASVEQQRAMLEGVEALPEPQREVVILRLSTDMKFEEIAELLQTPLGTVLSRMHSAVHRLKAHFGRDHE